MSNDSWWRRVTEVDAEVKVSSVWLGLNHRLIGEGKCPLPRRVAPHVLATADLGNHDLRRRLRIVRALREGRNPEAS
jgi:hypothetical protein